MNEPPQGQRRVVRVKRATPVAKQLEEAIRSPGPEQPQDEPQREHSADENPTDEPGEAPKSEPPQPPDSALPAL